MASFCGCDCAVAFINGDVVMLEGAVVLINDRWCLAFWCALTYSAMVLIDGVMILINDDVVSIDGCMTVTSGAVGLINCHVVLIEDAMCYGF